MHPPGSIASANSPRGRAALWIALTLLGLALEFLLFDRVGAKHHTWVYPRWNDQIQYLTESYLGYEYLKSHGFWAGVWATLVNPSAQGTLHDFFAVIAFSVFGASRSAALSLNLLALIAWQLALAFAVWRGTRSRALAWAAAAIPLALSWPWNNWAGSTADFRLDHLGMCALGVSCACAWLTDGFCSWRWSALLGVVIGLTLLTRFITGPYFVVMTVTACLWLLFTPDRFARLARLLLVGVIATAVAGPILWLNRSFVWTYYWIGHFTGPESAIRNPQMGLGRSIAFVWNHVTREQLGLTFFLVAAGSLLVLAVGMNFKSAIAADRRQLKTKLGNLKSSAPAPAGRHSWWVISTLFLFAPFLVLTLHQQKSEIVLGALVPGIVGLLISAWAALRERQRSPWPEIVVGVGVVLTCAGYFTARQLQPAYDDAFAADARKVNELADYLFDRSHQAHLLSPQIAVDRVTDCLDAQIMRVICYERKHEWWSFLMTLPTGIARDSEDVIFQRLASSDFVFLTLDGPTDNGGWPYDHQLRELRPRTQAWCESHLQLVQLFPLFGHHMALYQRREIPLVAPSQK